MRAEIPESGARGEGEQGLGVPVSLGPLPGPAVRALRSLTVHGRDGGGQPGAGAVLGCSEPIPGFPGKSVQAGPGEVQGSCSHGASLAPRRVSGIGALQFEREICGAPQDSEEVTVMPQPPLCCLPRGDHAPGDCKQYSF